MKHRPRLKVGDVCKFSKKFAHSIQAKKSTMVVLSFSGDSSEGHTRIVVAVSNKRWYGARFEHAKKLRIMRKNLWYTGYNINEKKAKPKSFLDLGVVAEIKNDHSPSQEQVETFNEELKKLTKLTQHKCTCALALIYAQGCQCGGA